MTQLKKISLTLKRNHKHLVDNLKNGHKLMDDLLSKNIISIDQFERLMVKSFTKNRIKFYCYNVQIQFEKRFYILH